MRKILNLFWIHVQNVQYGIKQIQISHYSSLLTRHPLTNPGRQGLRKDDAGGFLPVYSSDLVRVGLRVLQELQGAREQRWGAR